MKQWFRYWGLNKQGLSKAEKHFPDMLEIFQKVGDKEILKILYNEAQFQTFELPKREPEFQEKYLKGTK